MNVEIDPRKCSVLFIETTPGAKGGMDGSKIVITGSTTDIIFNWIALTASICGECGIADLNIRKGPGTGYGTTGSFTGKGIFTIVEESPGQGSTAGWGKLKSGAGWISLDYAKKI